MKRDVNLVKVHKSNVTFSRLIEDEYAAIYQFY